MTAQPVPQQTNQASLPAVPPDIKGFNFGAFALTWIWAIGNQTWLGLIALVPGAHLVMMIILGILGSEWAWKARKWDSIEHFKRVQRIWKWVGIGIFIAAGLSGILVWAFLTPVRVNR
jgi:hypothetical protein